MYANRNSEYITESDTVEMLISCSLAEGVKESKNKAKSAKVPRVFFQILL